MVEWEVTDAGLRVYDTANSEIPIRAPDIEAGGSGSEIPRPVDATFDCVASELHFPIAVVYVSSPGGDEATELRDAGPLELGPGEHILDIDAEIKTYLRIEGPATVRKTPGYDRVVVTTPERRRVTLGFRSRAQRPTATVTVPPTPSGMATAITHLASAHKTTGPERSYPTLRGHPPFVEIGPEDVPESVVSKTPDTGIELVTPRSIESLFVLAPLAYYLGATVRTADVDAPTLRAPGAGVEYDLPPMPRLQRVASRLLQKTFFMDCLVRNAGPYGTALAEANLLDALELDADDLYDLDPAGRLAAYMEVPYRAIEQRLPAWHLSTYVEPDPEHYQALPFLLDNLSMIYMPRTSELEGSELVERSLDDFYRAGQAGEVQSVEVVKPDLRGGRVHGWLAEGTPIDVFKSIPQAYHNRLKYLEREGDVTSITVVLNDEEMDAEHSEVAATYRERSEEFPLEVTVRDHLQGADLARVFEADNDFVHFIGHCERDGLRCPDGYLSIDSISESNTQTFFLNACGSYHQGMKLVEKGSVAGAVTFSKVLNEHAMKVGSAFARLLVHGFGIERAMRLARRRIMMGKDYAVVGDGTHTLTQSKNLLPATATLEDVSSGYLLTYDQFSTEHTGSFYQPYVGDSPYSYLCGNESEFVLDHEETQDFLDRAEMPVIYDGSFYWSDELLGKLR